MNNPYICPKIYVCKKRCFGCRNVHEYWWIDDCYDDVCPKGMPVETFIREVLGRTNDC